MRVSKIAHTYPTYRDDKLKSALRWLDGKRLDDNAEGLWRVHDKLYDLTHFIKNHPGGSDWLVMTKGVDITAQFETHHITGAAEKILPKYFVRDAAQPQNYKITFDESGFYKTLKRRVAEKYQELDQSAGSMSIFYSDFVLSSLLLLSMLAARDDNYFMGSLASIALLWQTVISHNFIHQKDNWRMYLTNLSGMNHREWRILHVMSHHHFPNSYHDLEVSMVEPLIQWLPVPKSPLQKRLSQLLSPALYALAHPISYVNRICGALVYHYKVHWSELLVFALPTFMYLMGNSDLWIVLKLWLFMILSSSLMHGFVGFNAGHHHDSVFHDGDDLKSMDFGVYQIAATVDKLEVNSSLFLALTNYGNHALHHMFPTLDHAVLPQLHETLINTCAEFECELREFPWFQLIIGQFKQLERTEPHKIHSN